jgi:hypothetical protein
MNRKNVRISRNGYGQVTGDIAGVAWARFGKEDEVVVYIHLMDETGTKHALFPLIFPYGKLILPKGTFCPDTGLHPNGEPANVYSLLSLPEDIELKWIQSPEDFLGRLGRKVSIQEPFVTDPSIQKDYGLLLVGDPLHPYFGMEMGGYAQGGKYEYSVNPSPKWPYDEFP